MGKFYWLKLEKDFFKRHDIRIIESMPNGKDYILFYLKLLCESLDHDGNLRFSEEIPYNEVMLSTITNTNPDTVRCAIDVFTNLGMMEILDDGTYYMNRVNKLIGQESEWAEKKRKYRESKKTEIGSIEAEKIVAIDQKDNKNEDNVLDVSGQCPTEYRERDKNNIYIYSARAHEEIRLGIYNNVTLTQGELDELMRLYPADYAEMIDNLSAYMRSKGKYYEDHFATMLEWKRRDESKAKAEKPRADKNQNKWGPNGRKYSAADFEQMEQDALSSRSG